MKKRNFVLLCIVTIILTFSINVNATECKSVISASLVDALDNYVYKPIKWATPILFIVLTSFDFAKVVFANEEKAMEKAKNNFLKRAAAALIIFFAPDIIKLLVSFVEQWSISSCMNNGGF